MWRHGLYRSDSGQGQVSGTCECGYESSGSIECGEYILTTVFTNNKNHAEF